MKPSKLVEVGGAMRPAPAAKLLKKEKKKFSVFVPIEIVEEIISWLPLKSIARFKCVSKCWYAITSNAKPKPRLLAVSELIGKYKFLSFYDDDNQSFSPLLQSFKGHVSFLCAYKGTLVLGYYHIVFLFNPITKYLKKLPYIKNYYNFKYGICYDSSADDYKLILVKRNCELVDVYHFGTKSWLLTSYFNSDYGFVNYSSWDSCGIHVEEKLHWLVDIKPDTHSYMTRSCDQAIIYFDVVSNKFREVGIPETPKPGEGSRCGILGLGVLDGCLAMTYYSYGPPNDIEVWVMKEHGVKESWRKLFALEQHRMGYNPARKCYVHRLEPFFFAKDGSLMLHVNKRKVMAYNVEDDSYRDVIQTGLSYSFVIPYQETFDALEIPHKLQAAGRRN